MKTEKTNHGLRLVSVNRNPRTEVGEKIFVKTDNGTISCLYHPSEEGNEAIIFAGDSEGKWFGAAGGSYGRWSEQFLKEQISSLRLDYRNPEDLVSCVLDTLMGMEFLKSRGKDRFVLVGYGMGGAVVIRAGAARKSVEGVAALNSLTFGDEPVEQLAPAPLLLVQEMDDSSFTASFSRDLYERAGEPKKIVLYKKCHGGLEGCKEALDAEMTSWINAVFKSDR